MFASHGWVFSGLYRRGQGLNASAGPYIGDQIAAANRIAVAGASFGGSEAALGAERRSIMQPSIHRVAPKAELRRRRCNR